KKANNKILIIDNYIDDSVLKMLTKKKNNVEVAILTSNKSNIQNIDIQKFNKEYPILKVAKTNKFHDRFIVIDSKDIFYYLYIPKSFLCKIFLKSKSIMDKLCKMWYIIFCTFFSLK